MKKGNYLPDPVLTERGGPQVRTCQRAAINERVRVKGSHPCSKKKLFRKDEFYESERVLEEGRKTGSLRRKDFTMHLT